MSRLIPLAAFLALLAPGLAFAQAGVEPKATPAPAAPPPPSAGEPEGKALFDHKCGMCHNSVGMGTGLLARRKDGRSPELEKRTGLPEAYIIKAARIGVGNMPPITRGDANDADLAAIAAYLVKAAKP